MSTEILCIWVFPKTRGLGHRRFATTSVVFTWCLGGISTCYFTHRVVRSCENSIIRALRCPTSPHTHTPTGWLPDESQSTTLTENLSGRHLPLWPTTCRWVLKVPPEGHRRTHLQAIARPTDQQTNDAMLGRIHPYLQLSPLSLQSPWHQTIGCHRNWKWEGSEATQQVRW